MRDFNTDYIVDSTNEDGVNFQISTDTDTLDDYCHSIIIDGAHIKLTTKALNAISYLTRYHADAMSHTLNNEGSHEE